MATACHIDVSDHNGDLRPKLLDAAQALREGALVIFPTETVYGIGARADNPAAQERLKRAKQRPDAKPFAYHVGSWDMVRRVAGELGEEVMRMLERYWPGPVTFLVAVDGGTCGIRFPACPVAREFLDLCGVPVKASSANISGQPSPLNAGMTRALWAEAAYVIDAGPARRGGDSTVVDLTVKPPRCVRCGVAPWP